MKKPSRLDVIRGLMLAGFAVLILGLFQTQVLHGPDYRRRSENNRMRLIRLEAPRGTIYDRNQIPLATNRPAYNVHMIPEDFDPRDLEVLGKMLGLTEEELRHRLSARRVTPFTPVLLMRDVIKEVAMQIEEQRPRLGGVFIQQQFIRHYPQGEVGAHLVGYIGKISRAEYEQRDRTLYHFNSWVGRTGIERAHDLALRGEDGGRQLEVNARGVPIRQLSERKPKAGADIYLGLDATLEKKLYPILKDRRGAILVMDVRTGELLSAVSTPRFEPNAFVMPSRSDERLSLMASKERPLLDRGFNGLYPPGSVFKLVTAMAAIEAKEITPHTTFSCPGYFRLNSRSRKFACWFKTGHGPVDLYTAIERSCNVYFYNVGRLLGSERIAEYARKVGFGSSIDFDLPTSSGLVPDEAWKKNRHHERWYPGETISYSIGQSYLLVSPLQILKLVSTVATSGQVTEPVLLHVPDRRYPERSQPPQDRLREGSPLPGSFGRPSGSLRMTSGVAPETFAALRRGMLQAVSSTKGTAQLAHVDFGKLAAKTGTAQAPPGEAHAWFGGFYPYENPEIALVIFVERGVSGGFTAAKLAKDVVTAWNDLKGDSGTVLYSTG